MIFELVGVLVLDAAETAADDTTKKIQYSIDMLSQHFKYNTGIIWLEIANLPFKHLIKDFKICGKLLRKKKNKTKIDESTKEETNLY